MITPPTPSFPYPTIDLSADKAIALTKSMMDAGWSYGLGSKVSPLSVQATDVPEAKRKVDCSGFVRWVIWHGAGALTIPDGSYMQHDWCNRQHLKVSTADALTLKDGAIRIAFLSPQGSTPGHVLLCHNGETMESHGGKGPDRRPIDFNAHPWMRTLAVFVLTAPEAA